jgi:hypothetical protein
MSRLALTPINVPASATDISTPTLRAGDLYYNTTDGLKVYTGSAWTVVSANTTITEIDAGAFDGVAPYMGGSSPSETSTQTVNGGTP